jgi:hypothetical protein
VLGTEGGPRLEATTLSRPLQIAPICPYLSLYCPPSLRKLILMTKDVHKPTLSSGGKGGARAKEGDAYLSPEDPLAQLSLATQWYAISCKETLAKLEVNAEQGLTTEEVSEN